MPKYLNRNKILVSIIILILALAIPLTLIQVQKQQEIRQRAAGNEQEKSISLNFVTDDSADKKIDEEFLVEIQLANSNHVDISAVDLNIEYNSNILELSTKPKGSLKSFFTEIFNEPYVSGNRGIIRYIAVNADKDYATRDQYITVATLTFKGKRIGTGNVKFKANTIVTASTVDADKIKLNIDGLDKEEEYTIVARTGSPILLPTANPTPTPPPGSTVLALSLTLEGIGANRTNLPSNIETSPVTVEVFKISGKTKTLVSTKEGNVEYESENGKFEGTVDIGNNLVQGQYVGKIRIDNYLKSQSKTFTVASGQATQNISVLTTLLAGDIVRVNKGDGSIEVGGDGKIDIADYNTAILACFGAKKNTPSCKIKDAADINHDRLVDGLEYNTIVRNIGKTDD